ncbi:hypothetical protein G6F46_009366 [Rhizopus delemar]|uniref:Uncharacterized protein n=2 Tax=Rhizopus TaxID=4842 RepID=A0A9P6ZA62_9FUNG|nr:hypothetical protein G6F55_009541 [Rhizopus delemar]KAG1538821.1 hypothetical protein G6F51_009527 [Rhizopus arrhizus]KAG1489328.1 hypothetical protein G6F54_011520 [Rhizopus delemar]KAG1503578.1 hypothetical protein G6F52_012265 [Rhizopus delemar]KAG1506256.1 hypothetical protein G6F53_009824 [Rhizopus delemar]
MIIGEVTDAVISASPLFRINARSVTLESKCIDSGSRVKLYISHPALMYYFIRFTDNGTRHSFAGSLNVSAYTFDDSTKAFANIRLSVTDVRPIFQVDDDGLVITTETRRIRTRDFPRTINFLKMKFIVYKDLNVEAFDLQLSDMYEGLGNLILIEPDLNPVFVEERITRPQNEPNTNRPVPQVMKTIYSYNTAVNRSEGLWNHASLRYDALINDISPFDSSIFTNDLHDDDAGTASHRSSTMFD